MHFLLPKISLFRPTFYRSISGSAAAMNLIGTHDGKFHCDEVLACYMLKTLPRFKDHIIVRTRDPEKLEKCNIVVDVGGVYDAKKLRFDHHQKEFKETMKSLDALDFDTKLSSAGLVYKHFGKEVIASLLKLNSSDEPVIDLLYQKMYEDLVHAVDAIDNGVSQFDGPPLFHLPCTLGDRVGMLNPSWKAPNEEPDKKFEQAMKVAGEDFGQVLNYLYVSWLPARELVQKAVNERKKHHPSGKILVLDESSCPWKDHFLTIEEEQKLEKEGITYMLFQDTKGDWRIMAIPVSKLSQFENRGPLPQEWCGLRDEQLSVASGIPDCIFVHTTGFIGGNKTLEGVIKMAEKALVLSGKWQPAN